jgi:predicted RecA/RadA family phage recombinase
MLNNPQANYVQRGEAIDFTNTGSTDIKANDVVSLATRIGVAGCDIPVGATGSVHVIGVYDIPASTTEAFTVGQAVYWKNGALTSDSTGAVPAGWVVEAKPTAKSVARVKIG